MKLSDESELYLERGRKTPKLPILIVAASLTAIVATYLLTISDADIAAKTSGFSAIVASFLVVCVLFHFWQGSKQERTPEDALAGASDKNIDQHLTALSEANEFFAGVLRTPDTFRLIAHRVKRIVPFQSIELMLLDESRGHLTIREVDG